MRKIRFLELKYQSCLRKDDRIKYGRYNTCQPNFINKTFRKFSIEINFWFLKNQIIVLHLILKILRLSQQVSVF